MPRAFIKETIDMINKQTNDRRALITAIIGSGLDDLNVMFLAFSLPSIISSLGISQTQAG